MSEAPPARAVVLLHGHGRLGASLFRIGRALRRAGYATWAPNYPYRRSLPAIVDALAPRVAAFAGEHGGQVHLVTHSFGGLVALRLRRCLPPGTVAHTVMLGPPHGGSEWVDLLARLGLARVVLGEAAAHLGTRRESDDRPLDGGGGAIGIIAGDRALDPLFPRLVVPRPNDGKVSVAATRLAGAADHLVLPVTHTLMVYDPRVIRQTLAFLTAGRFARRDAGR